MRDLVCVKDFEEFAYKVLPRNTLDYFRSGAGRQETLENNRRAFSKYDFQTLSATWVLIPFQIQNPPEMLERCFIQKHIHHCFGRQGANACGNIAKRHAKNGASRGRMCQCSRYLAGKFWSLIGQFFVYSAAESMGTIFILSTIATSSIEEVAEAAPKCIKWFQLYIYNDRWGKITILCMVPEEYGIKSIAFQKIKHSGYLNKNDPHYQRFLELMNPTRLSGSVSGG